MTAREQLIALLQEDFDTLSACELADELIAELRDGPSRTVRYIAPSPPHHHPLQRTDWSFIVKTEGATGMVERGYNESTRCLMFRVSFYSDPKGVREAVTAIGPYNAFDPAKVNDALDHLAQYISPYGRIWVGREYSPVLYIDIDSEQDHDAVKAILEQAKADEIDFISGNTVRAWWD